VRSFKILAFIILLAGIGLVAFAYLGDLTPEQSEMRVPVDLNGG
jgi:hypothetical protein